MEILRKNQGINSFYEIRVDERVSSNRYEEKMLRNNEMKYLPPLTFQRMDGYLSLMYKTDGMSSLARNWGVAGPGQAEVQRLLSDLTGCIRELQDYMLSPGGLVLSLPFIFFNATEGHAVFLYGPEPGPPFAEGMKRIFEEIMPIYASDREDELVWFYDLYSRFLDGSFTPEMLMEMTKTWGGAGHLPGERPDAADPGGAWGAGNDEGAVNEGTINGGAVRGDAVRGDAVRGGVGRGRTAGIPEDGSMTMAYPAFEDQEPYILKEEDVPNRDRERDLRIQMVIFGLVLLLSLVMFLMHGVESFRFTALPLGACVVFLICGILLKGKEEASGMKAGERKETYVEKDRFSASEAGLVSRGMAEAGSSVSRGPADRPTDVQRERIRQLVPAGARVQAPIYVSEGYCRIGRTEEGNEYCIPSPSVSRNHARLECVGSVVTLRDLGSTNGTFLNHVRLTGESVQQLHCGDVVSFAGEEFYVV